MDLSVELPSDAAGFVRRECPFCERQFKTRAGPLDAACAHRNLARQIFHENHHETPAEPPHVHCPYCAKTAPHDACLTPQQRAYLARVGHALAEELRYQQLSHIRRTLADNPYPTFVAVAPSAPVTPLTPEPDDMRVVAFLCCAEDAKVEVHWTQALHCIRCGAEHRGAARKPEPWGPAFQA